MRTKVLFSGTLLLAVVAVAVVAFASRESKIAANIYYYCWECASIDGDLECVQVRYESMDHTSIPTCPEGAHPTEGECAQMCVDPTASSSSESSVSTTSSDSSSSDAGPSSASESSASSSQSSEEVYVVIGNVPWTTERLSFFGLAALFVLAVIAGVIVVRRKK